MAEKKPSTTLHPDDFADNVATSSGHNASSKVKQQANPSALALEFITLTERPASQKANFQYTIRSHAMQSFLQAKKNPKPPKSSTKREPLAEVKSADQLSGKFKLSTWSRKSSKRRHSAVKEKVSDVGSPGSDAGLSLSIDTSNAYGSLPISLASPRTQRLLHHCQHSLLSSDNTGFTVNAFTVNYDNTWKPFSISDSALLHATLCLVAQHEDFLRGADESSTNLYHKGQVMKLINQRLKDDPHSLTDASVTAIALLVILEAINGTFEAASAHQIGLLKLIKLRGGICSFKKNTVLLRVLAWSDIVVSMRWGGRLTFPILYPIEGSLAENLAENFNLGMPPVAFPDFETNEVLNTIQTISYVMEIPNISLGDKKVISDAVHNIEYRLLSIDHAQSGPFANQECRISPLSYAFTLAALLYLEVIVREHPFISKVHNRLTSKLHDFLTKSDPSWYGPGSLPYRDVLLWIMFVKVVVSSPGHGRDKSTVVQFPEHLEIEENEKGVLRGRLKRIAWRDRICDYHLDRIWREMTVDTSRQ